MIVVGVSMLLIVMAGGLWQLRDAWVRRLDRPLAATAWRGVGAAVLLYFPLNWIGVWLGFDYLGPLWLLAAVLTGVVAGVVVEVRDARERRAHRELHVLEGMSPHDAARATRRQPRSFLTVLVLYAAGVMFWVLVLVLISVFTPNTEWINHPAIPISGYPGDGLPWWLAVVVAVQIVGLIHALTNEVRRSL